VKAELLFAALPSRHTGEAIWTLMDLFPQLAPASHVFQTSLDDPGSIVHPITTLLNMSRIEQMGPYRNAHYDITPSIARIIETVDNERMAISRALHYETYSLMEATQIMYKIKAHTLYDTVYQITAHNVQMAPADLSHRYVTEDVPYGMVPIASIGKMLGIPTPGMDAMIQTASMANGVDYLSSGRNEDMLGRRGESVRELLDFVTKGE